jgi:hypothetical protein
MATPQGGAQMIQLNAVPDGDEVVILDELSGLIQKVIGHGIEDAETLAVDVTVALPSVTVADVVPAMG